MFVSRGQGGCDGRWDGNLIFDMYRGVLASIFNEFGINLWSQMKKKLIPTIHS